jgi:hypothetical protein
MDPVARIPPCAGQPKAHIQLPDFSGEFARESGFLGFVDLLKVAKHGKGENIYLIRFHYLRPRGKRAGQRKSA